MARWAARQWLLAALALLLCAVTTIGARTLLPLPSLVGEGAVASASPGPMLPAVRRPDAVETRSHAPAHGVAVLPGPSWHGHPIEVDTSLAEPSPTEDSHPWQRGDKTPRGPPFARDRFASSR